MNSATGKKSLLTNLKHILHLSVSLLIVTAVAALILSLVNTLTCDRIAELAEEKRLASMETVMPEANVFSELYCDDPTIDSITGAFAGTKFLGYCIEVSPNGFGGAVSLMVGVNESGCVTGVSILDHSETASLGAKAASPDYLDQYVGKSGTIQVNTGKNAIDGLTGATITSKAITSGVNAALTAALNYDVEGGQFDYEGDV